MKCVEVYKKLYHQEPFDVAFCPYRISPLGAHIDHQYGKINGLAINKGIHMAYHLKQNGVVELQSLNFPKRAQFFVSAVPEEKQGDWADHLRGAAKMLGEKYRLKVGLSGIIEGSLPIGGLSSSASVIICFLSALRNFVYKRCEGLVYQTSGAKDYFSNIVKCKSTIICNPITSTLPKRYEGKRDHRIVNFCRIEPQKNLKLAIDAFNLIRNEFPDYTLEFYGDGSQRPELEKYVGNLQLGNRVIFHGYSPSIHKEIIKASLFVSASDYEGISNSMLEAMAIGLPTICTDCPPGGAKSVISNGINGVLVPVGDTEKLADAMRMVLKNEPMQIDMSKKASLLSESLKPSVIAKEWLNFADEVRR